VVTVSGLLNNKTSRFFYSFFGTNNAPFHGGFLCANSPLQRAPIENSGGTPPPAMDCSGVVSLDFNAYAAGALGGNPAPALAWWGTVVDVQCWSRDPGFGAPNNVSLSDALEYVVGP
jgi:hypothetical protein